MKRILFVIVLVAVMYATTGIASAKTSRTDFTGSEWCPDTITFIRAIEAGPNLHLAGISQTCYDTASIPQLTGTDYLSDSMLHLVGNGSNFIITGKLRMESEEGGIWVGSWVLPANTDTIQVIANGQGLYEGQELHWFLNLAGPFYGYILNTGN